MRELSRPVTTEATAQSGQGLHEGTALTPAPHQIESSIKFIPYTPAPGELVCVFRGPAGGGLPSEISTIVLDSPSNFIPSAGHRADALKRAHGNGSPEKDPGELKEVFTGPVAVDNSFSDFTPSLGLDSARITLFGALTGRTAYKANRDTLQLMAEGKLPTPPELDEIIATMRENPSQGRRAFEEFYESFPRTA